jgi:hypothetical protein
LKQAIRELIADYVQAFQLLRSWHSEITRHTTVSILAGQYRSANRKILNQ